MANEEWGGQQTYNGIDHWTPYEKVKDKAQITDLKYKDLIDARIRAGEDIDISKGIPSLEEMFSDDLAYDFFKGLVGDPGNGENIDDDIVNAAFYCETPPQMETGYHSDNTFVLETSKNALGDLSTLMHLNAIDGDTYKFNFSDIADINGFEKNGTSYNGFKDYCEKNNLNSKTLQVRCIGINCPEIPHYECIPMKESQIYSMTINEARQKGGTVYRKYNYKDGIATERNLNTKCEWYHDSKTDQYFEISEKNTLSTYTKDHSIVNTKDYVYHTIVTSDDSNKNTLHEGYRARTVAYSVLKNADKIMLKLDANGTKAQKTTGQYKLYYNHWWNANKAIAGMVEQWGATMSGSVPVTRLTYCPFGTDGYGRFVGEVYAYINLNGKMMWVNVNKYVMSHVDATEAITNPENSPELGAIFGDNSKAFDLWDYDKNNSKYLDSYEELTKQSYEDRLKFHKDITGIDFKAFRNCTMMIGDTLFLIPPTSIRNVSNVDYEKVSILRGKGSMIKNPTAREQYLEIDLYFYDEHGINGIYYNHTLPNGQTMTYYMNGLRALIAQFKVAPYLPIENQYVNDVLGIEAVSLVNLSVHTVEGFPRLLQATLTLRDFNYRIFMPDIPFDYNSTTDSDGNVILEPTKDQVSKMNPIFAKCFHWEIFRYYYQRAIAQGSKLAQFDYNSLEYNTQYYKSRNALKPVNWCDKSDTISFYIPDENWLSTALSIKKDREMYGQNPVDIELTEGAKEFIEKVSSIADKVKLNSDQVRRLAQNCKMHPLDFSPGNKVERKNVLSSDGKSMVYYTGKSAAPSLEDTSKNKTITVDGGDLSGERQSNVKVDIGFGNRKYWGYTNSHGQLVKVTADKIILQDEKNEPVTSDGRYYSDEAKVPGIEYDDLDEGHVIADSLGGVANAYNITPQNSTLNRSGEIYKLEEEIRKAGGCTNFSVIITYPDTNTQIPSHYSYTYTIDGKKITKEIDNVNPNSSTEPINKDKILQQFIMEVANKIEACGVLQYKQTDEVYDTETQILTWNIYFKIVGNLGDDDILAVRENMREVMGTSSSASILKNNELVVSISADIRNHTEISDSMKITSPEISAINKLNSNDGGPDVQEEYDYLNPAAMPFVPYLEEVPLAGLAFNMSNVFTEMSLKIMDGSAPQYMGASDISMELSIITDNSLIISMINVLPTHSMNIAKSYRRILNCWPIRVRQSYLNMVGINEVIMDSVQIENVEGYPGLFNIRVRMTSVDRVMRQREIMKQLDTRENITTLTEHSIGSYFDIENSISKAETYPDLDIPTLEELSQVGYKFLRYSGKVRTYPDPDFYMVYGYQYTAQIIKQNIRDVFVKNGLLRTDEENVECNKDIDYTQVFSDSTGQSLRTKLEKVGGISITDMNDNALIFTNTLNTADGTETPKRKLSKRYDEEFAKDVDSSMFMTLFDVEDGWQIKPGWEATICPEGIDKYVRQCKQSNLTSDTVADEIKTNTSYNYIFTRRKEIIEAIDKILAKPIPFDKLTDNIKKHKHMDMPPQVSIRAMFLDDEDGKNLLKLLCPMGDIDTLGDHKNIIFHNNITSKFKEPQALMFMAAYMVASACRLSGEEGKITNGEWEKWYPNHWLMENGEVIENDSDDYKDIEYIPLVYMNDVKNPKRAKTVKDAVERGFSFGMFQIKYETKDQIKARIFPSSKVDYLGNNKTFEMYENLQDGFIDPYYNKYKRSSDELKEYITRICAYPTTNAYAHLRICLMYLRKQIIDGLIISDLDCMAAKFTEEDGLKENFAEIQKDVNFMYIAQVASMASQGGVIDPAVTNEMYETIEQNTYQEVTDTLGQTANEQIEYLKNLEKSYARSFCARLILPFVEASTQGLAGPDTSTVDLLYARRIDELNLISASLLGTGSPSKQALTRFIMALAGNVIDIETTDTSAGTTSDSQKVLNVLMREAFLEISEDPRYYLLHSFYDMLVNDKRGRLIRAFPTYYVVFIDEGRRIGSWKLFDNFYNMSAISELTVSKSRKIPADTCSFVMTNMFGSYASEYDTAAKENYVDYYSIRDTFTSIFSPRKYITKEAALAKRKENMEQTILKPGVRIHIRMGYGSDAAGLPVVFNGKIAEIDIGDVVTVIGQGDGIELVNPLNSLGDIDATNLIEAQQWCTAFKDIRGSLARGGLSPRNLLSQILTAEHGGVLKNIARSLSGDIYYGDNPFGIYHFGDKRFADIFLEGEPTQNLYEVTDKTIMAGVNTLYPSEGSLYCSPTINTTIQDKTFWDLLQLCAYSGVGYMGAVRDFGFRSTVFLGKRNHYYAYGYTEMDGKYIEKRKPFQQFHYYDSYTDIIHNSIKASERNIKTNATGLWEGTDLLWGSESKTCGPIYLDINIYPEYQKSMTVDTGLVAAGNGGIDIPFMTSKAEDWNLSANTDKVNKTLAERITTNTLRESVMNMYTGELCVIGDPSVKPYDRISISDSYEDMVGQMEVEGVVYSMNAATGFTTTIYPDLIVRGDDPHEIATQQIMGTISAALISVVAARIAIITPLASVSSKLIVGAGAFLTGAADAIGLSALAKTSIGSLLHIEKGVGFFKSIGAFLGSISLPAVIGMTVAAATVFVLTQNAKSLLTRWLRNIQALDVYPVIKNQRPYIAGMNGHKGSVVGYNYSENDAKDSVQGIIVDCINTLDTKAWGIGGKLLNIFMDRNEYNATVASWSNTLTTLSGDETLTTIEGITQDALTSVSTEFSQRSAAIPMIKNRYRLTSFGTNNGTDSTYLKYRIVGVTVDKKTEGGQIKVGNSKSNVSITSVYTNKNILDLFPIEDDIDIKKGIAGTHSILKKFTIAHSTGPITVNIPFESGSRIIRFVAQSNPTASLANFPILDMPMIQEDALHVLKLIINDANLEDKEVEFMSGVRVNDIRTWRNTGFVFELHSKSSDALEKAIKNVKDTTFWTMNGKKCPLFAYEKKDEIFIISIYPEKVK